MIGLNSISNPDIFVKQRYHQQKQSEKSLTFILLNMSMCCKVTNELWQEYDLDFWPFELRSYKYIPFFVFQLCMQ